MSLPVLDPRELVVLAGAGISLPSGIASGEQFNERMLAELLPSDGHDSAYAPIRRWLRDRPKRPLIRFEQLVGILRDVVDPELSILGYMEESWQPATSHFAMAEAMRAGARLLTTNLDSLIEVACRQLMDALPLQIADVDEYVQALLGAPPAALFKLHGTLRRQAFLEQWLAGGKVAATPRAVETVAVTLDAIGRLEPNPSTFTGGFLLPEYISRVLEDVLRGRDLLVIGYSGSDDLDVMPTLAALRACYRRVVWVQHSGKERAQRVGDFTRVCGDTPAVLRALLPDIPILEVSVKERPNFETFLAAWRTQVGLDDVRRRVICAEILRQSGFLWDAVDVLESVPPDVLPPADAARTSLRLGEAMLTGMMSHRAVAPLERAAVQFRAAEDAIGFMQAQVGLAAAMYDTAILNGSSPNEALTQLARWMPEIREARRDIEQKKFQFAWPADVRRRMADDERRLQGLGMRASLLLSRIARQHGLLGSVALVQDVAGQPLTIDELLDEQGRFTAVHEDKLLYVDYLAEISLVNLILVRGDDPWERWRELRSLCRLLGLHYRYAAYLLDLGDVLIMLRGKEQAIVVFARARKIFERSGNEAGYRVAYTEELRLRGESPETIELKLLWDWNDGLTD